MIWAESRPSARMRVPTIACAIVFASGRRRCNPLRIGMRRLIVRRSGREKRTITSGKFTCVQSMWKRGFGVVGFGEVAVREISWTGGFVERESLFLVPLPRFLPAFPRFLPIRMPLVITSFSSTELNRLLEYSVFWPALPVVSVVCAGSCTPSINVPWPSVNDG